MKACNLVSNSSLVYYPPSKWVNSRELRVNRDALLFANELSQSTYAQCHDPLLDELRGLLTPPVVRDYRITERVRYFLGKLQRKLITPKVLRDDLPLSPAEPRPIRLIDPDKVIGVFYEHNYRLH